MKLSFDVAKMLVESGVAEKLSNLRSINLTVGPQPLIIEDGKRYTLEFAFSLVSQSTQSHVLSEFPYDYSIIQTIAQYPGVQNLVHLNFDSVKL
ncbi:hypothetical protein GGI11_000288 [Coemansia sp. RSA 2049]|nr:hypothetical protein GGI11_000288 [Coemansia sp. RSA 2049]